MKRKSTEGKKTMPRPRTFPAEILITVEEEHTSDEFLRVNKTAQECAQIGEKIRVGRYMLHEVILVEGKIVVTGTTTGR